jgi:hypothetical protein
MNRHCLARHSFLSAVLKVEIDMSAQAHWLSCPPSTRKQGAKQAQRIGGNSLVLTYGQCWSNLVTPTSIDNIFSTKHKIETGALEASLSSRIMTQHETAKTESSR